MSDRIMIEISLYYFLIYHYNLFSFLFYNSISPVKQELVMRMIIQYLTSTTIYCDQGVDDEERAGDK